MSDAVVPVAEGLFAMTPDGPRLLGSRCTACAALYFPRAVSCRNPACREKTIAPAQLPNQGTLVSFTVQRYRPPPLFRIDDWAPYAIGLVDLGEGVEVMGMLTGIDLDAIAIGMPLRLVVEPLFADVERGTVSTYKFAPVIETAA